MRWPRLRIRTYTYLIFIVILSFVMFILNLELGQYNREAHTISLLKRAGCEVYPERENHVTPLSKTVHTYLPFSLPYLKKLFGKNLFRTVKKLKIRRGKPNLACLNNFHELNELKIYYPKGFTKINFSKLKKLERLVLTGCNELEDCDELRFLKNIWDLEISGKKVSSVGFLKNFKDLRLLVLDCPNLHNLEGVENCRHLSRISISRAPHDFNCSALNKLTSIKLLKIFRHNFVNLKSLSGLKNIPRIELTSCKKLENLEVDRTDGQPWKLFVSKCDNIKEIDIAKIAFVNRLNIQACDGLQVIYSSTKNELLDYLRVESCLDTQSIEFNNLVHLKSLTLYSLPRLNSLELSNANRKLRTVQLSRIGLDSVQACFLLPNVNFVFLQRLSKITELKTGSKLTLLDELWIDGLPKLQTLQIEHSGSHLRSVRLSSCPELKQIVPVVDLKNFLFLDICSCPKIETLANPRYLSNLESLNWANKSTENDLSVFQHFKKLESLEISFWSSPIDFEKFPKMPNVTTLSVDDCDSIKNSQALRNWPRLVQTFGISFKEN